MAVKKGTGNREQGTVRAVLLAAVLLALLAPSASAQFVGYIAQQTVTRSFAVAGAVVETIIPLQNIGQAAHSLQVTFSVAAPGSCLVWLEGSQGGVAYIPIAAVPQIDNQPRTVFANGYYTLMRIRVNPNGAAGCVADVAGRYTGYQFPIPISFNVANRTIRTITAVVDANTAFPSTTNGTPEILHSIACYNPNQGVAFVQLLDGAVAPALGTLGVIRYEIGVPTATTIVLSSSLGLARFGTHPWIGAATAEGGAVAVGTGLTCALGLNYYGPFEPFGQQNQ